MGKSARTLPYKHLEKELGALRRHLLPKVFSPTGAYPDRVRTKTVAYRVQAHAEIEEYLEVRVWETAIASIKTLEQTGKVNRSIACLFAFSGQKLDTPPETLAPPAGTKLTDWTAKLELIEKAKSAVNAFKSAIDKNHGVREKDILGLLLPVGIQPGQLDAAWLSTIDAFGQERGLVAHHSAASYRAKHVLDPKTELNTVRTILVGLREIDDYLKRLS
jgi:hypothetical protein